jgi:hypothetical protein
MMLISELTFPHLMAEREAQLTRELERRRVLLERLGDGSARPIRARRHGRMAAGERMPYARRQSLGPGTTDCCPA